MQSSGQKKGDAANASLTEMAGGMSLGETFANVSNANALRRQQEVWPYRWGCWCRRCKPDCQPADWFCRPLGHRHEEVSSSHDDNSRQTSFQENVTILFPSGQHFDNRRHHAYVQLSHSQNISFLTYASTPPSASPRKPACQFFDLHCRTSRGRVSAHTRHLLLCQDPGSCSPPLCTP